MRTRWLNSRREAQVLRNQRGGPEPVPLADIIALQSMVVSVFWQPVRPPAPLIFARRRTFCFSNLTSRDKGGQVLGEAKIGGPALSLLSDVPFHQG